MRPLMRLPRGLELVSRKKSVPRKIVSGNKQIQTRSQRLWREWLQLSADALNESYVPKKKTTTNKAKQNKILNHPIRAILTIKAVFHLF